MISNITLLATFNKQITAQTSAIRLSILSA